MQVGIASIAGVAGVALRHCRDIVALRRRLGKELIDQLMDQFIDQSIDRSNTMNVNKKLSEYQNNMRAVER